MNKKNLFTSLLSYVKLFTVIVCIVATVASKTTPRGAATTIQKLMPSSSPRGTTPCILSYVSQQYLVYQMLIALSVNITKAEVGKNSFAIMRLMFSRTILTERQKIAIEDCLQMVVETLKELAKNLSDLHKYPSLGKFISRNVEDLKSLLSAAMTNQEICLDGFSHDKVDKKACTVTSNVVVAADESGNYRTMSKVVATAPSRSSSRYIIRIKAGGGSTTFNSATVVECSYRLITTSFLH